MAHRPQSMTGGGFPGATGACVQGMLRVRNGEARMFVAACRRDLLQKP
jgi:hypothetical protein